MTWAAIELRFGATVPQAVEGGGVQGVVVEGIPQGPPTPAQATGQDERIRQAATAARGKSQAKATPEDAAVTWRDFPTVVELSEYLRQVRGVVDIQLYRVDGGGFGLRPAGGIARPGVSEVEDRRRVAWARTVDLYAAARPDLDILVAAGAMTLPAAPGSFRGQI